MEKSFINSILNCDALSGLAQLENESVDTIMTSPPYYALRDYQVEGQIGDEKTFQEYIDRLMQVFNECKRVLKKTGSCWVVIGDTYGRGDRQHQAQQTFETNEARHIKMPQKTHFSKSLIMIPERFAIKMLDNGWVLRNKIIWQKRNVIPSSAKDRYTVDYENIYFFTKSQRYYFQTQYEPYSPETLKEFGKAYLGKGIKDYETAGVQNPSDVKRRIIARFDTTNTKYEKEHPTTNVGNLRNGSWQPVDDIIKMPKIGGVKQAGGDNPTYSGNTPPFQFMKGRIKRTVWTINTKPFRDAHFAVFPESLVREVINAGCPINGVILDTFMGAGTVALVALKMNRRFIGIELNKDYVDLSYKRIEPYLKQEKLFVNEVL